MIIKIITKDDFFNILKPPIGVLYIHYSQTTLTTQTLELLQEKYGNNPNIVIGDLDSQLYADLVKQLGLGNSVFHVNFYRKGQQAGQIAFTGGVLIPQICFNQIVKYLY